MQYIRLYILLLGVIYSHQFDIIRDDIDRGLVFQSDKYIHHQISEFQLNYMFNLTFLDWIRTNFTTLCTGSKIETEYIKNTLNLIDTSWGVETDEILPLNTIDTLTPRMNRLEFNLVQLPHVVCSNLKNISGDLYNLHEDFVALKKLDINKLIKMISIERIRSEVSNAVKNKTAFRYAFASDQWFLNDLLKQMSCEFLYSKNHVYLIMRIPLYEKRSSLLNRVYAKPIIRKGNVFLYRNEMEYAVLDERHALRFTATEQATYCFYAVKRFFCRDFKRTKNSCDDHYLNKLFNNQSVPFLPRCFERLKNHNIIIQINSQFYFLILTPMDIEVKIGQTHFTSRIYESSKIIEYIDYEFRTPFFTYTPNSQWKYQIFMSNVENSYSLSFRFYSYGILNVLKLTLCIFFIYILLILIKVAILCRTKCIKAKAVQNARLEIEMTEL